MKDKEAIKSTCVSCHGGCGVLVTVESGVITYLEGDPDSSTKGTMCAKGLAILQRINHVDRLRYPLKRLGKRGEGKWEKISWDEARDTIGDKGLRRSPILTHLWEKLPTAVSAHQKNFSMEDLHSFSLSNFLSPL